MRDAAPIRVMALHALAYCERLFYLEEVEEIRVALGGHPKPASRGHLKSGQSEG